MASLIGRFLDLSLPLKILIGAVVAVIAGPGLLAFLSEYATYLYAMESGVRPPMEGIPYLRATVAIVSLALAVCASLVFLLTRFILGLFGAQMVATLRQIASMLDEGIDAYRHRHGPMFRNIRISEAVESIRNLSFLKVALLSLGVSLLIWLIAALILIIQSKPHPEALPIAILLYVSIAIFTLWNKAFAWFVAGSAVVMFYVVSLAFLFDTGRHALFLRTIGYGGGIPVQIDYENGEGQERINLTLRTTEAMLGKRADSIETIEIPLQKVRRITYLTQ